MVERQGGGDDARPRFPTDRFARAWGQFAAHAVLSAYIARHGLLRSFDPAAYWKRVMGGVQRQALASGTGGETARMVFVLACLYARAGRERGGLSVTVEVLRQGTHAFRFAVTLAQAPPPASKEPREALQRLRATAEAVLKARESSLQYAIVPGGAADGGTRDAP